MAARFENLLVVAIDRTSSLRAARLVRPLVYISADGTRFEAPAGYHSDLASIPWWARWAVSPFEGLTASPAVLHDWLYSSHIVDRKRADTVFAEALGACGVKSIKRWIMYRAVRLGGARGWMRDHISYRGTIMKYEDLKDEYRRLWDSAQMTTRMESSGRATAKKIVGAKSRYQAIESQTGVPWFVVGCIHAMESGCRWNCHLHNGDPLSRRTRQVPAGRPLTGTPPFTWEESAADAITQKNWHQIADWPIERILFEMERYNGWGYRKYHAATLSPYLWSGTSHYARGKYVADGKWSSAAVSGQSGAAMLLRRVAELDKEVVFRYASDPAPDVPAEEIVPESYPKATPRPVTEAVKTSYTIRGVVVSLAGLVAGFFNESVQSVMDAAEQVATWGPATGFLGTLGFNAKTVGLGLAVAGLAIVVSRRLQAASKGKIG